MSDESEAQSALPRRARGGRGCRRRGTPPATACARSLRGRGHAGRPGSQRAARRAPADARLPVGSAAAGATASTLTPPHVLSRPSDFTTVESLKRSTNISILDKKCTTNKNHHKVDYFKNSLRFIYEYISVVRLCTSRVFFERVITIQTL